MSSRDEAGTRKAGRSQGHIHETVDVRHRHLRARIDKDIAPLILETWRAGVETHCSCQDASVLGPERQWVNGWIQLGFPSVVEVRRWSRIITKHQKGGRSLYNRITQSGCRGVVCWHYEISAYDASYDEAADDVVGPSTLEFRVFVYFPRRDLAVVMRRLHAFNRRSEPRSGRLSPRSNRAEARS